jgi:hypothetical protein
MDGRETKPLLNWIPTGRKKRGRLRIRRMEGIRYVIERETAGRKKMYRQRRTVTGKRKNPMLFQTVVSL